MTGDERRAALVARLDAVARKLEQLAARPTPAGRETGADPDTGERWDAGQLWAHLAEVGPFWLAEAQRVAAGDGHAPVPFGRTLKGDVARARAVKRGRGAANGALWPEVSDAIDATRVALVEWTAEDLARPGSNVDLGRVDVAAIVDEMIVSHYEEHAEQLETLLDSAPVDPRAAHALARFDAALARLHAHAAGGGHRGLTAPDAPSGEQWEAGQVWAHLGEFGAYWLAELDLVVGLAAATPVPFGRTKRDAGRIAAIEEGRDIDVAEHLAMVDAAAAGLRARLEAYTASDWSRVGHHESLGDMDVEHIVDEFLVGHYEQHADQLDELSS